MKKTCTFSLSALALCAGQALAAGPSPGLYEFSGTVKTDGPAAMTTPFSGKQCLTAKDLADGGAKAFSSGASAENPCSYSDYATSGNSARWTLSCNTQGMVSKGSGSAKFSSSSYDVNSDTVTEMMGMTIRSLTQISAKRVADCSESSFQTSVGAVTSGGAASGPANTGSSAQGGGAMKLGMGLGASAAALSGNADAAAKIAEVQQMLERMNTLNAKISAAKAAGATPPPAPRGDSSGEFVLAYKADGSLAPWADKALTSAAAGTGANLAAGKATDAATEQLAGKVPLVGGMIGGFLSKKAKAKAQETGVVMALGGWDGIRADSDRSFDDADALAVYLHTQYATQPNFAQALASSIALYPALKNRYETAVTAYAEAR